MINTESENNLEDQLKGFQDQIIKVIDEKCLKITENVTEEKTTMGKEVQQLRNEVIEEKNRSQKTTDNITK